MNKIVITGANGFIGTNVVKVFAEDKNFLPVAMIYPGTDETTLDGFRCEKFYGDMLKPDTMAENFSGAECVVHLAGLVTEWGDKALFEKYITQATSIVFETAVAQKVKKFIYMSSLTIHGFEGLKGRKGDENTGMKPYNNYAKTKLKAEKYITRRGKETGIEVIIIRPGFIVFGEYDKTSFIQYLDLIAHSKVPYLDHGSAICSFVYAENLARGIKFLYEEPASNGPYIIVDSNMTWKNMIEAICEEGGYLKPKSSVPYWLIKIPVRIWEFINKLFRIKKSPLVNLYRIKIQATDLGFSGDKIEKLGYKPFIKFKDAIRKTLSYYRKVFTKTI